jgi:hypothetical protein
MKGGVRTIPVRVDGEQLFIDLNAATSRAA